MTGAITAIPKFQFSSNTGIPLSGGTVTVSISGGSTPTETWQDLAQTVLNTNPIILDSRGEATIFLNQGVTYRFVLKNAAGVTQWTQDGISGTSGINSGRTVDTLAALKALDTTTYTNAATRGYYATGDGGHGDYYFVAGSQVGANNGNLVASNDGLGLWKLLPTDGTYNVLQFGAYKDGTNATITTAAFNTMIVALGDFYKLIIPNATAYYAINDTINIKNRFGFHMEGSGNIDKCVLGWLGASTGRMIYQNDCRLSVLKGFTLKAGTVNSLSECGVGLTVTNTSEFVAVSTQNRIEDLVISGFTGTGSDAGGQGCGLEITSSINSQNDLFEMKNCHIGQCDTCVYVQGASTFLIRMLGGSINDFYINGVDLDSGFGWFMDGVGLISGGAPGTAGVNGTGAFIKRKSQFGILSINNCHMEGKDRFLQVDDDSGSANEALVYINNFVGGTTTSDSINLINHEASSPFTMIGGSIGASYSVPASLLRFNIPGAGTLITLDNVFITPSELTVTIIGNGYRAGYDYTGKQNYIAKGVVFPTVSGETNIMTRYGYKSPTLTLIGKGTAGTYTETDNAVRQDVSGRVVTLQVIKSWTTHTGTGQLALSGTLINAGSAARVAVFTDGFAVAAGAQVWAYNNGTDILFYTLTAGVVANLAVPAAGKIEFVMTYTL